MAAPLYYYLFTWPAALTPHSLCQSCKVFAVSLQPYHSNCDALPHTWREYHCSWFPTSFPRQPAFHSFNTLHFFVRCIQLIWLSTKEGSGTVHTSLRNFSIARVDLRLIDEDEGQTKKFIISASKNHPNYLFWCSRNRFIIFLVFF